MEVVIMRKVIIYTQETCPPCHAEKLWFKENGIEFEERDIRNNDEYLQEIIALGAAATPATVIKDGDSEEVVLGFDQSRLAEILGL
jgi:glutaredoxin